MAEPVQVEQPPEKPVMVYDGECYFCCFWIRPWQQLTGSQIEYRPFQDPNVLQGFSEIPKSRYERAVHLIQPDGSVSSGAEAVFRALARNPFSTWPLWLYQELPAIASVSEWNYRLVARHRTTLQLLARNPFPDTPPRYVRAMVSVYHFSTPAERKRKGEWWQREANGAYLPPISLRDELLGSTLVP